MSKKISSRRWNQFIAFVNDGRSKSELDPPIKDKYEEEVFDGMVKELEALRKDRPQAAFAPVETDW